ncbi:MAG: AbrB/MazE/SpoVT family DNA-binding domain-containing protein [Thermoplasmata archaeon]|nr:AbrB/MazE/SpoVT family DNA-binding domain-containing protein [Thermoplasmata archaeon]
MAKPRKGTGTQATKRDDGCCGEECCGSESACCGRAAVGCCQVAAVVGVDARGQMVLPKEVRDRAGIKAGDKLAVLSWAEGKNACCLMLLKADALADTLRAAYGPILADLVRPARAKT